MNNITNIDIRHSVQSGVERFFVSLNGAPEKEISKEEYLYLVDLVHSDEGANK